MSLMSPKITLAPCLLLAFVKMEFCFYLEKKTGPAKTEAAGPSVFFGLTSDLENFLDESFPLNN